MDDTESVVKKKIDWKNVAINGVNWFTVFFAAAMYIALGIMKFEDGQVSLNDFSNYTWLDWIIWSALTFVPPVLAVTVSTSLKREGIRQGEARIATQVNAYYAALKNDTSRKIRSKSEFLGAGVLSDSLKKFSQALVVSFISGQMIYSWSVDSLLKIIINLSMWAYFGFGAFGKAHEYATTELKEWYIVETEKLEKLSYEEMVKSGRYLK